MTQTYLRPVNGDVSLLVDATAQSETVPLPAGFATQRRFTVRRADASGTFGVTVTVPTGGSIDGVLNAAVQVTGRGEIMFTALDANAWVSNLPSVTGASIVDGSVDAADLSAAALAAAVAAGSGTYAKIPSPAGVAFVGDSIINNSGTFDGSSNPSPRYECRAWMEWARAINGASWERVGPSDKYGWATGGYTTDQIIAAGYHTSAASSSATIVAVLAGTNDLAAQTAAYVLTNLQALWAPSLAAGKTVIACTLLPRSDQIVKVDAVNLLIRRACATTKNLVLCDMYGAMVDPSTGAPLTTRSDDGVHPNLAGAGAMGVVFAQVMASLVPAGSPPDVRIEASADAITRNPFGLGNASGLPTNWSKFNLGSGSAVATKVARTDAGGEWTNLVVTSAAPNADGIQLQVAQPSQKWAIGDTLRAVAELDITAGFDLRGLMLYAYGNAATAQAYWGYRSSSDGTALTAGAPVSGRLWLVTPVWTVPGTATGSMTVNLQVYGPGTIRVGRMGIVRV